MSDQPGGYNFGEIAGLVTAAGGVLVAIGAGAKWLLGWFAGISERRAASRAAKLQAWHDELAARERAQDARDEDYRRTIEARLATIEAAYGSLRQQHLALRLAFDLLADGVRSSDPTSDLLRRAEDVLKAAYPIDPATPAGMISLLGQIPEKEDL